MTGVPVEIQVQIIQQKIQIWRNTQYDAQLDAEVALDILGSLESQVDSGNLAQVTNTNQVLAQAKLRMKSAKRAVAVLERRLSEIGNQKKETK